MPLVVWPTALQQTAPVLSGLMAALSQQQLSALAIDIQWDSAPALTVKRSHVVFSSHFFSSTLGIWYVLGRAPVGRPLPQAVHFALFSIVLVWFTKRLTLFSLSTGHFPSRTVACQRAFWQTPVGLVWVSLLEVGFSWAFYHGAHFHSDRGLKLLQDLLFSQLFCFVPLQTKGVCMDNKIL